MAFCMAIILFVIGYVLIHQEDTAVTLEAREERKNLTSHLTNYHLEYLLVWGVYAYYAKQSRSMRPQPYRDAVRHARLEMMRRGYRTSSTLWYDFRDITPQIEDRLNFMGHYTAKITNETIQKRVDAWPFKNAGGPGNTNTLLGPHVYYWGDQGFEHDPAIWGMTEYRKAYLYNRLAEWYYLVMFKDQYLSLGLDINNALCREASFPKKYQLSESYIDKQWDALLSEIQGIVYWGDKWDAEIHAYQQQEAARKEAKRSAAEEPGEERRRKLLEQDANSSPSQTHLPTLDEMTPEWAQQQLKEKYGINYDADDSH